MNVPVTLDGSCSTDPGGGALTYEWDFNYNGSTFTPTLDANGFPFAGATATKVDGFSTYTVDAAGVPTGATHTVCLRVRNSSGASATTCANLIIKPPPHCPTASAGGPYLGSVGVPVQLDASGSFDVDNDPLTYAWDFDGDGVFSSADGQSPSATFSVPGVYPIAVRVTDHPTQNAIPYNATECSVTAFTTVEVADRAPVADAGGPYFGRVGQTIALDGSGSFDPDGDAITYAWDLTGNGLFSDSASPTPSFAIPGNAAGMTLMVCLRVTDTSGKRDTRCATVSVYRANRPPTASVTRPSIVSDGPFPLVVRLDASPSSDPDGDQLAFSWTADAGVAFDDATSPTPNLTFVAYGTYLAHVAVTDGTLTATADVVIDVVDRTPPAFTSTPSDLVLEADANTNARIVSWLGSVSATDSGNPDPVTVTNDFVPGVGIGGVGAGNTKTVTWTATDSHGNSAQASATVTVVDTTAPILHLPADITVGATSAAGAHVDYAASAADLVSGDLPADCAPASGSTFPAGETTVRCSATDSAGNTAAGSFRVTVVGDTTPPHVTPTIAGTIGANGWYTTDVHVSWSVVDGESTTSTTGCGAAAVTVDTDGETFTCSAASAGGTTTKSVVIKRDATPPDVTFTGNRGSYGVDQLVDIACHAADPRSGLASATCPGVSGPAWTFGVGLVSRSVSVQDRAGNTGTGTVSFTVVLTAGNLCGLTVQFIQSSVRYGALSPTQKQAVTLLGTALCRKLALIVPRLNPAQRTVLLRAYNAGTDVLVRLGWLTLPESATLKTLAAQL